jgi:hypothetical protein
VSNVTRLQVGLYGLVFHLAAAGVLAAQGVAPRALVAPAAAAAVAGFAVYALVVTRYAQRRLGSEKRGVVLYDFLVGMLAEVAVVAVASVLHAIPAAFAGGPGSALGRVAGGAAFSFLWVVGTAFTEVLVLGNAAGFIGYIVLKKLAARRATSRAA